MKDSITFHSRNELLNVSIPSSEVEQAFNLCAVSAPYETGGILVGHYSSDKRMAIVTEMTHQPPNSVQKHTWFFRSTTHLLKHLNKKWAEDEYYLGEWHYHPNASPMPSSLDIKTIKACAANKRLNCPEPLLFIIGGNPIGGWNLYCGVVFQKSLITLTKDG